MGYRLTPDCRPVEHLIALEARRLDETQQAIIDKRRRLVHLMSITGQDHQLTDTILRLARLWQGTEQLRRDLERISALLRAHVAKP